MTFTNLHHPSKFTVIAGPCVIEGDGAVNVQTAKALKTIADALDIELIFKSSFDKANRSSGDSYRGPGTDAGLALLKEIKAETGLKILTDVHEVHQIAQVAEVADWIQIPAFLSRQTDLLVAAGESGKVVNIKKGQFLSPHDMVHAVKKVYQTGNTNILVTERGSSFGYNNLVVDMRVFPILQSYGVPVMMDATHSVQLPGGQGSKSGGQREYAEVMARAAVAVGAVGLFMETHPNPDVALSDGPNMVPLHWVKGFLESCLAVRACVQAHPYQSETLGLTPEPEPALV